MPKKFLKRCLPHHDTFKDHKHISRFGTRLHDPNIWHLNRRSVSGAFAVGLFLAFFPFPSQMILAAGAAIWLRVNLPISVALVWISNPLTIPFLVWMCYQIGAWTMNIPHSDINFEFSAEWMGEALRDIWQPLLLGALMTGTTLAVIGYFGIHLLWRLHVWQAWNDRKQRQRDRARQRGLR